MQEIKKQKRGFTTQEKWVIWAVFCLLVGLSTHRFTVFFGMLLASFGISLVFKKHESGAISVAIGIAITLLGLLSLAFSRILF
ncbi:MAG: hypothetical protein ACE5HO_01230 [bacterium]